MRRKKRGGTGAAKVGFVYDETDWKADDQTSLDSNF